MVRTLRNLNQFFGIKFKIDEWEEADEELSSDEDEEKPKTGNIQLLCDY